MKLADPDSAAWSWLILALLVLAYVVAYDLWAWRSGNLTLSRQMTRWIFDPVVGPFIVAAWVAVFVGLMWHFLVRPRP